MALIKEFRVLIKNYVDFKFRMIENQFRAKQTKKKINILKSIKTLILMTVTTAGKDNYYCW